MPRRLALVTPLLALAIWAAPASAKPYQETLREAALSASKAARAGDCKGADAILAPLLDDPDFRKTPPDAQAALLGLRSYCAMYLGDKAKALQFARQATDLPQADDQLWVMRFELEMQAKSYADALKTAEAMRSRKPGLIDTLNFRWMHELLRGLKMSGEQAGRARLLAFLASADYQPTDPFVDRSRFRYEHARVLAEAGDMAGAREALALVRQPHVLRLASVTPGLRKAVPDDFDFRASTERFIALQRELAAKYPDRLQPHVVIAAELMSLGKLDEAHTSLEALRKDVTGGTRFSDLDEQSNWWWDQLSDVYVFQGRYEEAVAAMRAGAGTKEQRSLNVSQTLNLASLQTRFGHHEDALNTLAEFEKSASGVSGYGWMQFHKSRACAAFKSGKMDLFRKSRDYLTSHSADDVNAGTDLASCTGDVEAATKAFLALLENPDTIADALIAASDFAPSPPTRPKSTDQDIEDAVLACADVKAAIDRAGGTRHFPVIDVRY